MLINNGNQLNLFRIEFNVFLAKKKLNLKTFVAKHNNGINFVIGAKRTEDRNYSLINQRLNTLKKIDTAFFQKLIDLEDPEQKIQFLGPKVVISKQIAL